MDVGEIVGKIFKVVEQEGDHLIRFVVDEVEAYVMEHCQICCERVTINDVAGDLDDLVGRPILLAEEVTEDDDSGRWTFYKFATALGYVTVRWYGLDNYYSVKVSFYQE
jgi:hypothetical protein